MPRIKVLWLHVQWKVINHVANSFSRNGCFRKDRLGRNRSFALFSDEKTAHYVANVVTPSGIGAWIVLLVVSAMILSMLLGSWCAKPFRRRGTLLNPGGESDRASGRFIDDPTLVLALFSVYP